MQWLWAVAHGLERVSKRMGSTLGITGPQRLTLRVIGLFPDISAGELAEVLRIHPSTLTGILQRLVDRGWVARSAPKGDRRLAVLRLTAAGRGQNRNSRGTLEAAVRSALARCRPSERTAATRVLGRLAEHLDPDARGSRPRTRGKGNPARRPGATRRTRRQERDRAVAGPGDRSNKRD
ncbi:MAG: MarR family winged helix-turn-helix transcriptional regulator [Acidobacteriota bacterium]